MNKVSAEEIETIVKQFEESGCSRLHLKIEGFEILLSNDPSDGQGGGARAAPAIAPSAAASMPARSPAAPPASAAVSATPAQGIDESLIIVRAPYLGTFYRSPKPGSPPFVEVGTVVRPEQDLCLVEVMKLFTAVRAEAAGTVRAIYAQDGEMVEAGKPLLGIEPA